MALVICAECKSEISDTAEKCPKCGFIIPRFSGRALLSKGFRVGITISFVFDLMLGVSHFHQGHSETYVHVFAAMIGLSCFVSLVGLVYSLVKTKFAGMVGYLIGIAFFIFPLVCMARN